MSGEALARAGESVLWMAWWWSVLLAIGAIGWLALRPALASWHDAGWALARPLAMLALAFAIFVAAHIAPVFTAGSVRIAVIAAALAVLAARRRSLGIDRTLRRRLALAEMRFLAPFVFYAAMRGFSHDIVGLEKFMDFAFVNAALAGDSAPVADPWYAGESINYYYFGHYVTAFLARLSGTPSGFAYNLMLATLFATTFQLAYAIVAELARRLAPPLRGAAALVAGLWLVLGGNVHGFLYGFVKPWLIDAGLVAPPRQSFLLSDPTRFVGWDPPTQDRLIHEFPAYAFYVGDLHAHLINLPSVLTFVAALLAWRRADLDRTLPGRRGWLFACAWLVGIFAMSNSWDALMYATLLGAVLAARLVHALRQGRERIEALADGLVAAAVSAATAMPFLLHFRAADAQFLPTHSHTPAWQWAILYGLQATLALAGAYVATRDDGRRIARADAHVLALLTLAGLAFALVPEIVYLKDIYGADFYRANTAFKFGFQAFTLLTLAASAGIALAISAAGAGVPRIAAVALIELALVPPLYYGWFVLQGGFGVWREREWTLDGQRFLAHAHPEDLEAIRWLQRHPHPRGSILVEAPGESYTFGARVSTHTGIPAVLGWPVHEQLWRGSSPSVWQRRDDVDRIYGAKSTAEAAALVERYGVRWLVVGRYERERYPSLDADVLAALGRVAFRAGETFIVEIAAAERAASVR